MPIGFVPQYSERERARIPNERSATRAPGQAAERLLEDIAGVLDGSEPKGQVTVHLLSVAVVQLVELHRVPVSAALNMKTRESPFFVYAPRNLMDIRPPAAVPNDAESRRTLRLFIDRAPNVLNVAALHGNIVSDQVRIVLGVMSEDGHLQDFVRVHLRGR